jgi:Zn-dependent protease
MNLLEKIVLTAPPLILAVVLHEIAHGWVAWKLGDPTAKSLGRLSVNPLRHIDPVMTLLLPGLLILAGSPVVFGGAKPVPINPGYFKNPRLGMVWVAVAGPVTNFLIAGAAWGTYVGLESAGLLPENPGLFGALVLGWLTYSILVNVILGVFNLCPVPPLDGGRIAVGLLPRALALPLARLEQYGLLIVFGLLYAGVFDTVFKTVLGFLFGRGEV